MYTQSLHHSDRPAERAQNKKAFLVFNVFYITYKQGYCNVSFLKIEQKIGCISLYVHYHALSVVYLIYHT